MSKKKIALLVVAVIGGIFLTLLLIAVYNAQQLMYQANNFDKLWNESLTQLRSGEISMLEYCEKPVHSEEMCNEYKNLHGIK